MTADDTSREALIESLRGPLANVLCNASNFPRRAQPHLLGADMGPLIDKTAEAVVDAVVAAIERAEAAEAEVERLRIQWDRSGKNDLIEQRDIWRERWRQLMRDYEAVFDERDELEAECLRVDEVNTRLGERVRQQDEVIERVRALLGEGGPWCWSELADAFAVTLDDLRAALEGYGR